MQIEVHPDHEILEPPNRLKSAMTVLPGQKSVDLAPVERAERAIAALAPEFDDLMLSEVSRLKDALAAIKAEPASETARDEFYRACHDIRGQAQTFGFPLVGEVADGLCGLIEDMEGVGPIAFSVLEKHVDAVSAICREKIRGGDLTLGRELVDGLARLRGAVLG